MVAAYGRMVLQVCSCVRAHIIIITVCPSPMLQRIVIIYQTFYNKTERHHCAPAAARIFLVTYSTIYVSVVDHKPAAKMFYEFASKPSRAENAFVPMTMRDKAKVGSVPRTRQYTRIIIATWIFQSIKKNVHTKDPLNC